MYTINIERKRLLKQRREKALQNAKDRKLAKENTLTALKAHHKADRASNDTQSSAHSNDDVPSPLLYGRKQQIQAKSKPLKSVDLFRSSP